jgi:plastocyanin
MQRWSIVVLVALMITITGCGAAGASISSPTSAPTPMPTLASSTEKMGDAPAGAIPIIMTAVDAGPRFQPDNVTAKAGTVVFFLKNLPGKFFSPDHNLQIGPASTQFYADGSIRSGQVLAGTPHIAANESAIFTVNNLAPGTYLFWCSVEAANANHEANGMVGTLTITP